MVSKRKKGEAFEKTNTAVSFIVLSEHLTLQVKKHHVLLRTSSSV